MVNGGEAVVELRGLSLCYRLAHQRVFSFKEYLIHTIRGSLSYQDLWALQDIDLTVPRSEVLGIIGRNGAGKSSLLKVIAGVLKATRGERRVHGKVSPILELGTGFDFELTGLENIYLNGLLRGHSKIEVRRQEQAIIDFSGLGEFIHSPVRNYSTGMMARLGFAVATAWVPDLLVLDEVLAVGDARFLKRCHERLEEYRQAGTTVLIVSHNPLEILHHCNRCLWLDGGRVQADGEPRTVVRAYAEASGDAETVALLDAEA